MPLARPRRPAALFVVLLSLHAVAPAHAQPAGAGSLDARLLFDVYHTDTPAFRGAMRAADVSAYPVFYGAPVAAWGGAWLIRGDGDWTDAYRLALSQVATAVSVIGLKRLFRRPRPYNALAGITARTSDPSLVGSFSMPSGHAALAFTLATSWSLSHEQWYVVVPSVAWAGSVALSRVWLGVHYPSDVLAGSLLGAAVGVGMHLLGPQITPDFLKGNEGAVAVMPMLHLRFALP